MRDELFIWFDSPPKVSRGAFNYVSEHWENCVYFIVDSDFRAERKLALWERGGYGNAIVIKLFEKENPDEYISQLFESHKSAIHIVNGFYSKIEKRIRTYLCRPQVKVVFSSERPVCIGGLTEKFIRKVYHFFRYNYIRIVYSKYVKVLLPLGDVGCRAFRSYGWPMEKLFPFMYNPELPTIDLGASRIGSRTSQDTIRFIYVGRFSYRTKGVDILMKSIQRITGNWHLDMVGGYGDKKEEVIEWCQSHNQVSFLGTWDSASVPFKLLDYDIVLVPTRFDGWNLLINEAINSGVGVITTDEAVSDEVITNSGCGIVVDCSPQRFSEAMQRVINDTSLIRKWHDLASTYRTLIASETVGKYLIDILDYSFYGNPIKPQKPW